MGPTAKPIVPALALELKDDDSQHRREAAFALAALGPDAKDATPVLIEVMTSDEEPSVRHAAIYALGKIGPAAAAAKEALNKNMESDDKFTKVASVWALLQIQPTDKALHVVAVPLFMGAVENAEIDRVRFEAATALGNIGPAAKPAVDVLKKAAESDDSPMVREAAAEALKKIENGK
jgi:HEAT repeat protein